MDAVHYFLTVWLASVFRLATCTSVPCSGDGWIRGSLDGGDRTNGRERLPWFDWKLGSGCDIFPV